MAYIVPKGSFAGREWRFPIKADMAMNVGLVDKGAPFPALAPETCYQGVIHRPGGHGYFKTGRQGAMVEIPALPKAGFFTRDEVAGWLKVMDEMEAQHKRARAKAAMYNELLYGKPVRVGPATFTTPDSSAMTGSNRQEVSTCCGACGATDKELHSLTCSAFGWAGMGGKPDISTEETLELTLPSCTANPSCGEDDVDCSMCRTKNCPSERKCWKCQGVL